MVIIIGAGPAGLTAAYKLIKAGIPVTVLEQDNSVGGLSKTIDRGSYRFDLGGHRWYSESKEVDKFFKDICGADLLEVPRITRIYFQNHFYTMPIQPLEIMKNIGLLTVVKVLWDYLFKKKIIRDHELNLQEAYQAQFGEALFKLFFEKYNEKLWGRPCSEMSGSWIGIRAKGLSLGAQVKSLFVKDNSNLEAIDSFYYPRLGIGQFSDNLHEEIIKLGGKVLLNTSVTGFKLRNNKITAVTTASGEYEADYVITTQPLPSLSKSLAIYVPKIYFRDLAIVTLFLDRQSVTRDSWVYTQEPGLCFSRFHEPKNWSPNMCPSDKTVLVTEIPCNQGDETWNESDEKLVSRVFNDLVNVMKLANSDDLIEGVVVRTPYAYPVYTPSYRAEVEKALQDLSKIKNLKVIGRQGKFFYGNMDQPILTAFNAAEEIINEDKN